MRYAARMIHFAPLNLTLNPHRSGARAIAIASGPTRSRLLLTAVLSLAFAGCTPVSEIERECAAHPPRLPEAPVSADGFFVASYWMPQQGAPWPAELLLKRGFRYVETDRPGGGFRRYDISTDEKACAALNQRLAGMSPQQRALMDQQLAMLGLKSGECIAETPISAPTSRYRIEMVNHSPPRNNWIDGLTGRRDIRVQAIMKDVETGNELANIRSVTLSYQVTVSGNPVNGCNRRKDVSRLVNEFIQPADPSLARSSALEKVDAVKKFPVEQVANLEVVARSAPGGTLDWRRKNEIMQARTSALPRVALVGAQGVWTLNLPVGESLRAVPQPWIGEVARAGALIDQPPWTFPTGRGFALLLVWRHAERVDAGTVRLTWAEYSATGEPLRRVDAAVPLDAGINPYEALIAVPVVQRDAVVLEVTEVERGQQQGKDVTHAVRRVTRYRLPLA